MKSVLSAATVVLVVAMTTTAFGQIIPGDPSSYPSVSIVNTQHNLNNYPGVSIPGNQVCLPCHTPHNALLYGEENVLWNHEVTGETFVMYSSEAGQPEPPSLLCLSCHDGVTAIDSYGGNQGNIVITGDAALGTDLSNDHPIGIEYPTDRPYEYNDPSTFDPGINGGPGIRLVDMNGVDRVECTSCHEPHNNGLGKFLRVPLQESYICLQCHIK